MDCDARDKEAEILKIGRDQGKHVKLFFLPGPESPESWVWDQLKQHSEVYAGKLKMNPEIFLDKLRSIEQTFSGASDKQRNIAKGRLITLSTEFARDITEICRVVGSTEAEGVSGDMGEFVGDLEEAIQSWRSSI